MNAGALSPDERVQHLAMARFADSVYPTGGALTQERLDTRRGIVVNKRHLVIINFQTGTFDVEPYRVGTSVKLTDEHNVTIDLTLGVLLADMYVDVGCRCHDVVKELYIRAGLQCQTGLERGQSALVLRGAWSIGVAAAGTLGSLFKFPFNTPFMTVAAYCGYRVYAV
jgi:hypothetical protein